MIGNAPPEPAIMQRVPAVKTAPARKGAVFFV